MQPRYSRMTSTGLLHFIERWNMTKTAAAERLGLSQRAVYAYLAGERRIPQQLAILIKALDELWTLKRNSEK